MTSNAENGAEEMQKTSAIIIALTGPSSSGKSTLARALLKILPDAFILHQDDFYKPEAELPDLALSSLGGKNWDNPSAFNFHKLLETLQVIRETGSLPLDFKSTEAEAHEATAHQQKPLPISDSALESMKGKIQQQLDKEGSILSTNRVCILDGIHLLSNRDLQTNFSLKLFIHAKKEICKSRREGRPEYLTLEGWWKDPPFYFDKVVWPEYIASHAFLFKEGDVDGIIDENSTKEAGVWVSPVSGADGGKGGIEEVVSWAVETIVTKLKE